MSIPEKKKYKNNFLAQVVYQLSFDTNDAITDEALKAFKEQLGESYAELSNIKEQGIILEKNGSQIISKVQDKDHWQIPSADGSHVISITSENFTVTHYKYDKYRENIVLAQKAQKLFFDQFDSIDELSRLGLRYVNQIAPESFSGRWNDYINSDLVASLNFIELSKLRRAMSSMLIQYTEDIRVTYNFGIFNDYFPAPISKNEFILDLDAFIEGSVELEECDELSKRLSKVIAIYFEESITDTLREIMGEITNEE